MSDFLTPASMRLWRSSIARRVGVQTQHVIVQEIRARITQQVYGTYNLSHTLNRVARRARAGAGADSLPPDFAGGVFDSDLPFDTVVEFDEDEALIEDEDAEDAEAMAFDWSGVVQARNLQQAAGLGLGAEGIDVALQVVTSDLDGQNPDVELQDSVVSFIRSTTARFLLEDWLREWTDMPCFLPCSSMIARSLLAHTHMHDSRLSPQSAPASRLT
jgi:hypothetical protein